MALVGARAAVLRSRQQVARGHRAQPHCVFDKWLNYHRGTLLSYLLSDATRPGLLPVSKAFIVVIAHGTSSTSQWYHCARSHRWRSCVSPSRLKQQRDGRERQGTTSAAPPLQCAFIDGGNSESFLLCCVRILEALIVSGGELGPAVSRDLTGGEGLNHTALLILVSKQTARY